MSEQPEALRLAAALSVYLPSPEDMNAARAELRRLHAENEALRADAERLDWCLSVLFSNGWLTTDDGCGCCGAGKRFDSDVTGRAAIDAIREAK